MRDASNVMLFKSPKRIAQLLPILFVLGLLAYIYTVQNWIFFFDNYKKFVPGYPSAQQVSVHIDYDHTYHPAYPQEVVVTFLTSDSTDAVFLFYQDALAGRTSETWELDSAKQQLDSLIVSGHGAGCAQYACMDDAGNYYHYHPTYEFEVKTQHKDRFTYVTVKFSNTTSF